MIKFKDYKCDIVIQTYANGGKRISLREIDTGDPIVVATSWIEGLDKDEVAIKDYSENEGILDVLISHNVIHRPHRTLGMFPISKLKIV